MGYLSKTVLSSNIHIPLENPPLENPLLEKVEQNAGFAPVWSQTCGEGITFMVKPITQRLSGFIKNGFNFGSTFSKG